MLGGSGWTGARRGRDSCECCQLRVLESRNAFRQVKLLEWLIVIGGLVACFFIGLALVRAIAWVIWGFTRG